MKLKLHMDDYLTAIAGVSLLRLQDWACRELPLWQGTLERDKPIQARESYLEVDAGVLEHLPEWYFTYLMRRYSVSQRERDRFRNITDFRRVSAKEQIERLKKAVGDNLKKLVRYFPDHSNTGQLQDVLDEIRRLKLEQAAEALEPLRDRYVELLATEPFEERLTLNVIRSFLSNTFYGQTSMLQRTRSNYTLQQHIEQMKQDFVDPVLQDVKILEWVQNHPQPTTDDQKQLIELLKGAERYSSKEWSNPLKKLKPEEIHGFLRGKLRCSFEDEWFATMSFEEMVFAPLAVSGALPNFNWDFVHHQMPISSWIRLVLFLAPAGLTPFTRYHRDTYETFYCFVYRDGKPADIYRDNNNLDAMEHNDSFDQLIPKLVAREEYKAKREAEANIQIIEFSSDIGMRKTVLNYYHIPRQMIRYFTMGWQKMRYMHKAIRDPFLRLVMESVDPVQAIWDYLQRVVRGKGEALSAYFAVRERWLIELLKKEGDKLSKADWEKRAGYIHYVYQEGVKVRKGLESRSSKQAESTDYVSSGSKRAAGIAHRLLNAARANDRQQFLDTVIRLYLTVHQEDKPMPVPYSILNVLHEDKVDFATWAGAFIAGLLGQDQADPEAVKYGAETEAGSEEEHAG